jgi:hypothetical protein
MPEGTRFVVDLGGSKFSLPENFPWVGSSGLPKNLALRLGWRCLCSVYAGQSDLVEEFLRSHSGRIVRGLEVNVVVRQEESRYDRRLIVDLWTELKARQEVSLRQAVDTLKAASEEVAFELGLLSHQELKVYEEFLMVKLPKFVARQLGTSGRARVAVGACWSRDRPARDPLPTVQLNGTHLVLGPEPPGAVDAVQRYLQEETGDGAKDAAGGSPRYRAPRWIPFAMAAALVVAWALPLKPWSVAFVGGIAALLIVLALLPAREIGFSATLRQTTTMAALGLFWIAAFGVAYATCALLSPGSLGSGITALGYPFLVATGLGVAGGILGENPTGAARIVAHIQLLLFLSGLVSVLAILLRIDRAVMRRRE